MRDHLLLYINGRRDEVRGRDAFLSLSDYLRQRCGLIGTKIVCSEGDCGACTTLIGREQGGKFVYRPVDSCIQFLFQLDGTHVVTVEGLRRDETLNAVQQAMVDCHGSQCGFCTPGFVMAMTGLLEEAGEECPLETETLRRGLTGNLCRCTGYTPILEAGMKCQEANHQRLNDLYPAEEMLAEFREAGSDPVRIEAEWYSERHLAFCPTTLNEATAFLAEHPTATIIAGATDVGVRVNKAHRLPPTILDLNRIAGLDGVRHEPGELVCGARANWTTVLEAFRERAPEFTRVLSLFGAPQIRHVGTIAGNIANASPIADSLPFFFVMEATLVLASATGRREANINEFYRGYKQLDLRPGELIAEVRVPLPAADELLRLYKVTRRRDLDISGFTAAVRVRLDGDVISAASIAFGAVGPTVLRARRTEEFLVGQPLTEETMRSAGGVAMEEITPIDDVRGSADYRRQLARNVLLKFYFQTQDELMPV